MKDLLKLLDLSREEIVRILDVADQMKYDQKHRLPHPRLQGKTLAMIFEKNSTRTRVSFENGMFQLGGHALFLSGRESQIGRGEPVEDTARVLSRYCDGIMIRTYSQEEVEKLARYADIPVINGLTDFAHPCQVLADLMTIRERKARLEGLKMCFIGDGNNMVNSLIVGCLKVGMEVSVACPEGYDPHPDVLAFAQSDPSFQFPLCRDPKEAAVGADVTLADIARLCDAFYIGGTKVGAFCGEAVVFTKPGLDDHFFTLMKKRGALLAKGRFLGLQFDVLFGQEDGELRYQRIGRHAVELAQRIAEGFRAKDYELAIDSPTNQQFVILDDETKERLAEHASFGFWERTPDGRTVVRFATSWATRPEAVDELLALL